MLQTSLRSNYNEQVRAIFFWGGGGGGQPAAVKVERENATEKLEEGTVRKFKRTGHVDAGCRIIYFPASWRGCIHCTVICTQY